MNKATPNLLEDTKSLAFRLVLVAVVYFITAKLGLMVPYKESVVTLMWLPTGVAVGAIMRWGKACMMAIFLSALVVELSAGLPFLTSISIALTNTLAPLLTATLLKKFHFNYRLIRRRDILQMIVFALVGMLVSSIGGTLSLYFSQQISQQYFMSVWFIWWVGDSMGVMLALPLIMNIGRERQSGKQKYYELLVWISMFALGELLISYLVPSLNRQFMVSIFLVLPILIWASMNLGIVGGSLVVIAMSAIVVWFTANGYGAFYSPDLGEGVFSLWTFMTTLVITMLLISVLQSERNQAEKAILENDKKLRAVIDGALDAIVTINRAGELVEFNPAAERIFGYKREQVLGQPMVDIIIPPSMRQGHSRGYQHYLDTGEQHIFNQRVELNAMRSDGSEFPIELTLTALNDDNHALVTGFIRDISEQKMARQEIENFAYYDGLTGLPNRRLLADRFQLAALKCARTRSYCALIFIDLDNFKQLNDTKGHDAGDQLLIEVARRIRHTVRAGDTVARLSGDEFVVIIEELDNYYNVAYQQVNEIVQKLLAELNKTYLLGLFEFNTSASIGISLLNDDQQSFEHHLRHADTAMYEAKAMGRNTYRFYDQQTQESIEKAFVIESALPMALKNQEFYLNYQAIVDAEQQVTGAEVLLRWQHPVMGLISPADFIPIAEKNNHIIKIGRWVLEQACRQLKAWENHLQLGRVRLSVNISAKQFLYINFIQELREILADTGANPDSLKLELTETAVIDNIEDVINKFIVLRQMRVQISLDDFGIGHSSLVYLKKLPVTQIKIDQSFVHDVLTDSSDAAIIQMVLAVGKTIHCDVVAEGVEQLAQFERLKSYGCQYFQGFYFSRPVVASAFELFVTRT